MSTVQNSERSELSVPCDSVLYSPLSYDGLELETLEEKDFADLQGAHEFVFDVLNAGNVCSMYPVGEAWKVKVFEVVG